MRLQATKVFSGFSTCFRQWRAEGTHCRFLHGYGTSFKVWFEGELDERNWVFDFGGMKRSTAKIEDKNPKDYFNWLLDHTTIIAADDPQLETFQRLDAEGLIQLRVLPHVGCERFAYHLLEVINAFLLVETKGRVLAVQVEFRENENNSATAFLDVRRA